MISQTEHASPCPRLPGLSPKRTVKTEPRYTARNGDRTGDQDVPPSGTLVRCCPPARERPSRWASPPRHLLRGGERACPSHQPPPLPSTPHLGVPTTHRPAELAQRLELQTCPSAAVTGMLHTTVVQREARPLPPRALPGCWGLPSISGCFVLSSLSQEVAGTLSRTASQSARASHTAQLAPRDMEMQGARGRWVSLSSLRRPPELSFGHRSADPTPMFISQVKMFLEI